MKKLIFILIILLNSLTVNALDSPTLPQAWVDTTYSLPTGNTINVNSGGNFQTALNNAALNDVIVLEAGTTFTGNFTLPNKTSGSGWIYIVSSAYSNLPQPGSRVAVADAANMPKIKSNYGDDGWGTITATAAHHYRFVGIEFSPTNGVFLYNLIQIRNGEESDSDLPHHIIFDRCYIHGDATLGGRRGIALNGNNLGVVDSYISDFKEVGADSQGICAWNGSGPWKIVNNYIESAGENVMFGGTNPSITNCVPTDIEFRRNKVHKKLAWQSESWVIKNLFELKNAKRVLVEGNEFKYNWGGMGQNGTAILFTPRNDGCNASWTAVQDITFKNNKVLSTTSGLVVMGDDDVCTSQRANRIHIENNLFELNVSGKILQVNRQPENVRFIHNTGIMTVSGNTAAILSDRGTNKSNDFEYRDNLVYAGTYGFWNSDSASCGTAALTHYFTTWTWENNGFVDTPDDVDDCLPGSGETILIINTSAVGFVDYDNGDYELSGSSSYKNSASDGTALGMNFTKYKAAAGITPIIEQTGGSHTITLTGGTKTITLP